MNSKQRTQALWEIADFIDEYTDDLLADLKEGSAPQDSSNRLAQLCVWHVAIREIMEQVTQQEAA
jgi:hypothetical protein